ncbi:MAG: nucleotidyl transferase AbiEii/AbiGii toxin family protein [Mariniphaga sp.]
MHNEILSPEQIELLPLVKQFKREFYLVGGTAIALHIGHRRSVDFDLFKNKNIRPKSILTKIADSGFSFNVTRRVSEQMNVTISTVKFTFYEYPFPVQPTVNFDDIIRMPSLIDLAAMKAYAFGRRAKWKDYVDMYFLLRNHFSVEQISKRAVEIFDQLFSSKLFRAQLSYFKDIDYSEPVEFLVAAPPEEEIRQFLVDKALDISL